MPASRTIEHHARHHRLIQVDRPGSPEEAVLALMFRKAYEEAATLIPDGDAPVLDLGCNTGYGTAILRERTGRGVIGVDVSASAVETARARYGGDFRVVGGHTLPFQDATFDAVTCCQVIEHIDDPDAFLAEVRRVLRPGGRALFTTPNAATRLDPGERPWNRFHVREFRAEELQELLAPHFTTVDVRGLFGTPEIEGIERARVARLRKVGRVRNRLAWLLPLPVEDALVRSVRAVSSILRKAPAETELATLETAGLYYAEGDVDRALDLLAICHH